MRGGGEEGKRERERSTPAAYTLAAGTTLTRFTIGSGCWVIATRVGRNLRGSSTYKSSSGETQRDVSHSPLLVSLTRKKRESDKERKNPERGWKQRVFVVPSPSRLSFSAHRGDPTTATSTRYTCKRALATLQLTLHVKCN